jgi:tellurite resistance protein TerC
METGFWGWVSFNAIILALLALDLGVFHRRAHVVKVREAAIWSAIWVTLALLFNLYIYLHAGRAVALDFLTGYLVEKSLSVDNIFVMVMIFGFFNVPAQYQHRVLFWGVVGALIMRGIFIGLGTYVLHHWHPVIYVFGGLLVVTGIRMAFKKEETPDLSRNFVIRMARRLLPVTSGYRGQRFLVREGARLAATPLLLVLLLVEVSDLVFAVDSIPAIFAITDNAYVVYTSNVFAILGLRSMYFLLANVIHRFVYLKYGLAVVLVFIGTKMLIMDVYRIPTFTSLLVVAITIGVSLVVSLRFAPRTDSQSAPARADGRDSAGGDHGATDGRKRATHFGSTRQPRDRSVTSDPRNP